MSPRRIHFLLLCSTGILSRSSQTGARGWQSEIVGAETLFGPWRRPSLILLWTAEHYRICKRLVFGTPKQPRMDHAPGKSGGAVEGGDQLRKGGRGTRYEILGGRGPSGVLGPARARPRARIRWGQLGPHDPAGGHSTRQEIIGAVGNRESPKANQGVQRTKRPSPSGL